MGALPEELEGWKPCLTISRLRSLSLASKASCCGEFAHAQHVVRKGAIELVTELYRAAEARIVILRTATCDCGFVTEESAAVVGAGDARWIIDPLGSTPNYAMGARTSV